MRKYVTIKGKVQKQFSAKHKITQISDRYIYCIRGGKPRISEHLTICVYIWRFLPLGLVLASVMIMVDWLRVISDKLDPLWSCFPRFNCWEMLICFLQLRDDTRSVLKLSDGFQFINFVSFSCDRDSWLPRDRIAGCIRPAAALRCALCLCDRKGKKWHFNRIINLAWNIPPFLFHIPVPGWI